MELNSQLYVALSSSYQLSYYIVPSLYEDVLHDPAVHASSVPLLERG